MSTIVPVTFQGEPVEYVIDGELVPVVAGFDQTGKLHMMRDAHDRRLARIPASECDHAGATWSSSLALICLRCGAPLFLPPRLLAHLPADVLNRMHEIWIAAGWPEWTSDAECTRNHWWTNECWHIVEHPLFAALGGIPVRRDRRSHYNAACIAQEQ